MKRLLKWLIAFLAQPITLAGEIIKGAARPRGRRGLVQRTASVILLSMTVALSIPAGLMSAGYFLNVAAGEGTRWESDLLIAPALLVLICGSYSMVRFARWLVRK